jgi:hypothetical protein
MNSREKGKRGERRWRDVLRDAGFQKAHRGVQYSGGSDSPDVACPELPGIHFENIWRAMAQSIADAGDKKIPVVAHTRNRSGWLVTMRAEDWLALIRDGALQREDGHAAGVAPEQSGGARSAGARLRACDEQSDHVAPPEAGVIADQPTTTEAAP